jgi:hypothetical protein
LQLWIELLKKYNKALVFQKERTLVFKTARKKMHRITNTFPLLEDFDEAAIKVDPQLAHARIIWLNRASKASQDEFALKLMQEEPQGEAFDDALLATVLTMDKECLEQWLKMETAVAAKKIEANIAHMKLLYKRYSIAVTKQSRVDNSYMFKFPHQDDWTVVNNESYLSNQLAKSAFPLVPAIGRYSSVQASPGSDQAG